MLIDVLPALAVALAAALLIESGLVDLSREGSW